MRKTLLIVNLIDLNEFVLCEKNKTALYTGLCNHSNKTSNRTWYDKNDIWARGKSVETTQKAIRNFFTNYEDYTLAFSIGTQNHEGCVFVKKMNNTYHLIHFNPTFEHPITIFKELAKRLNIQAHAFGYQPKSNNSKGECSYLAWKEMIDLLADRIKPFNETYSLIYEKRGQFVYNIEDKQPIREE